LVVAAQWTRDVREGSEEMAKKVTVTFVDDLDGSTADRLPSLSTELAYDIDLSTRHAKKLRAALQPGIQAGGASGVDAEPRSSARAGQRHRHESPQ
jgi:Lsr2